MIIEPFEVSVCQSCGIQLAPAMRACPACGRLVHSEMLANLAKSAEASAIQGDYSAAMAAWRNALDLLPTDSKQHRAIAQKITELGQMTPTVGGRIRSPTEPSSAKTRAAAGVGAIGLLVWKLKSLVLGLAKSSTLISMFLSFGVYWTAWGWPFALGIVVSIYIHEMGHVVMLERYGFKATAPMFVPGLGALIRLQQHVVNPREDADIGLAGPIYGFGAAVASLSLWLITKQPIFAAIGGVGAWINLFNLLPIATLDGGRAFHSFSRIQKLIAAVSAGVAWLCSDDGMILVLALVCCYRALTDKTEAPGYWKAAVIYYVLIALLTAISAARHLAALNF